MTASKVGAVLMLATASVFLVLGLILPLFEFVPVNVSDLGQLIGLLPRPANPSVLGGIAALAGDGHATLAVIVLLFSVAFPLAKLTLLWLFHFAAPGGLPTRLLHYIELIGPWSMADVFILSLLVVSFQSFQHGNFNLCSGFYCFTTAVVTTLIAAHLQRRGLPRT